MDKAKAAITDFMGRSGHHDTTVHEAVAPAVTQEVIKPHTHEEVNTAIDKEVHQDHYHRTIQPVHDREVLPERHEAKIGSVQHREFDHRDHEHTKRNLVADQARFKDERRIDDHTHSQSVAPVVGGEHIHHHIHETIQPVVQKETIQPSVIHTTVPIHEVHHNKATHHDSTALPAMTMEQFKAKGGALTGREERYDEFEGVPKNIGGSTAGGFGAVRGLEHKEGHLSKEHSRHGDYDNTPNHHSDQGLRQGGLTSNSTTHNPADRNHDGKVDARDLTGSSGRTHGTMNPADRNNDGRVDARDMTGSTGRQHGTMNPADRNNDGRVDAHDLTDSSRDRNIGATGTRSGTDGAIGSGREGHLAHRDNEDGTHQKPGLMAKLNPKVDANGDGKAGFMK